MENFGRYDRDETVFQQGTMWANAVGSFADDPDLGSSVTVRQLSSSGANPLSGNRAVIPPAGS